MFKSLFSGARPKKPGASASRESLDTDLTEEPVVKVSAKRASKDKSPRAKPHREKPQKEKPPKEKKRSGTGASPFGSGLLLRRGSKDRRRAEAEQERRLQEDLRERDRILAQEGLQEGDGILSQAAQEGRPDADGLWEVPLDSSASQTLQVNGHPGDDVTEGRPHSAYSGHSSSPATSPTSKEKQSPKKGGRGKRRSKDRKDKDKRGSSGQLELQPPPPPSVTLASRRSSSSSASPSEPPQSLMGPRQPGVSEVVEKLEKSPGPSREVSLEQKVSLVELKVQESMVVQQMRERQQRQRMEELERSTRTDSLYATVEPRNKKKPEAEVELPPSARQQLEKQMTERGGIEQCRWNGRAVGALQSHAAAPLQKHQQWRSGPPHTGAAHHPAQPALLSVASVRLIVHFFLDCTVAMHVK